MPDADPFTSGRSFATRRVVARQAVGAILNLEASFQAPEESADLDVVAEVGAEARVDRAVHGRRRRQLDDVLRFDLARDDMVGQHCLELLGLFAQLFQRLGEAAARRRLDVGVQARQ